MENVINNTEPKPSIPHGANGHWEWDGNAIVQRGYNVSGQEWFLKGKWNWIAKQVEASRHEMDALAKQPINVIANYGRCEIKPNQDTRINKAFNSLFILCGAITVITLILIITN